MITDHHLPPPVLPRAVAVVDPHRPDCAYPDPDLTGAGLSYKLAAALLARHGMPTDGLAAVAAIGTVADLAPMTGESRAIVRLGLDELAHTAHAGLRALLARGCDVPGQPTARDLAYGVVPRINAAGRIADAELAIALLLEEDPSRAEALADELEVVHERRRELTKVAVEAARALVEVDGGTGPLLVRDDAWAPGLVGLVAGRLADSLARPVAAATLVGEEVRGSVRAPADFHVAAALEACAGLLTKRGGHAAAGGFSLLPGSWDRVLGRLRGADPPLPAERGGGGGAPGPARRRPRASRAPARLGAGGAARAPRAVRSGPRRAGAGGHRAWSSPMSRRVGASEQHVALRMRRGLETFDAIAFGLEPERPLPEPGDAVDLVGTLERDDFGGMPRLGCVWSTSRTALRSPLMARRLPPVLARAG